MKTLLFALALASSLQAGQLITWKRIQLTDKFYAEGATFADVNNDGKMDIISGPYWYEGPDWKTKHAFYAPKEFSINGYSDNFFAYAYDFNGDGWKDILVLGFPGKEARLYMNPGKFGTDEPWATSIVADVVDNESPTFTDITGDGKPEIVCSTGGKLGYFEPDWSKPTEKWKFVAVSDDQKMGKFTHGLGVGDVNGDGKMDLLEARHWWEHTDTGLWKQHTFAPGIGGGAQMFAYDFDGDGRNDVFTSLQAHRYGVSVFLNHAGNEGAQWEKRMLASEQPYDNDYGIVFSQPHASCLADVNGDGVQDIIVGKRYWAHNGHDPDERSARVIYWYETKRLPGGKVDFIPHLIDANSGVGTDVQAGDVNGDGLVDVVVGNKAGVFVLLQQREEVSAATAAQMEPKKMYGPGLMPQKDYAHGQTPKEAVKAMQLPAGFKAELIAGEPELVQPIAMCWDERGRLWVVEGMSYPQPRAPGAGKDRILIFEDTKGNGTFDKRTVFAEGLSLVSGIEVGFGGVWVGAAPYLMFIADKDRDDKPDVTPVPHPVPGLSFPAEILLDGWGSQDTHETLNSFIWGPDGWLYGCQGVFTYSNVGKPGAPDSERAPLNCCVWRYHPVRHQFEVFAHGTSNPWGLDYDQNGEFFVTACVIPHLYHIVPGARYQRQGGQHFNPYTYEDIKTIADHAHYAGNIRDNAHWGTRDSGSIVGDDTNADGGGHAHCGLAIYQSSQFPATYRNQLIFGNLHGHRLVTDYLDPHGSTYMGKHGSDFMRSNDMNFIPVTQKVGPDGALYVSDWSDKQVCHRGSSAVELWDRSNGRIFRISYAGEQGSVGTPARNQKDGGEAGVSSVAGVFDPGGAGQASKPNGPSPTSASTKSIGGSKSSVSGVTDPSYRIPKAPFDLWKESDETLVRLAVQTDNEWFARMARRVLRDRVAADGTKDMVDEDKVSSNGRRYDVGERLLRLSSQPLAPASMLRVRWVEESIRYIQTGDLKNLGGEPQESIRAWLVRCIGNEPVGLAHRKEEFSKDDPFHGKSTGIWFEDLEHDLIVLATKEPSAVVRRELASLLQKLPVPKRGAIASALLKHGEDKEDPYIPLLIWYGIEPLVGADPKAGLELAKLSKLDKVTGFIYRRLGAEEAGRTGLITLAAESKDPAQRETLLHTVIEAARAGNKIVMPGDWAALKGKLGDAPAVTELEAFMGVPEAKQTFRAQLANKSLPAAQREAALSLLLHVRDSETASLLQAIIRSDDKSLSHRAVQGLATLAHPGTPALLIEKLASFDAPTKNEAINTLATTVAGARLLLGAVKAKQVPLTMLSPFLARQMDALKDAQVTALLKEVWGDLNAPKADLPERKAKFRAILTAAALAKTDPAKGKLVFMGICGQCHKLFGEGQNVGPDLTGSNRANLDYLLDNVLDPNAVIGKAYQLNIFELKDGRITSGVVKEETPAAYRIAMPGGFEQTLTVAEVKKRTISKVSTMPEGIFEVLPQEQLIQLVAYLQSHASGPAKGGPAVKVPGALEGEELKVIEVKGGNTKVQGMGGFGNAWSGGKHLWWTGARPGSTLTLELPVADKGKYALTAALTKAKDYGIIDVSLDGKPVATDYDGFNGPQVIHSGELDWGAHDLDKGAHKLVFTIKGANPEAVKSFMVGLDYVRLEKK